MTPNVLIRIRYVKKGEVKGTDSIKAKAYEDRYKFYSSNQKDDYVSYMDQGSKEGEVNDYISYQGNLEKSHGVFNAKGLLSNADKKEIRQMLRTTDSPIWDMVISFEHDFGLRKIKSYKDAMELVKKELPSFLKRNGIKEDNVIYFAALHENTDNRHIHLSFFEKEPTHKRANKEGTYFHNGRIILASVEALKVKMEEELSDNKYFFESYRRNLISSTEEALNELQFRNSNEQQLKLKLKELHEVLPKGKASYGSLKMAPYRHLINEAEYLLMELNPGLKNEYFKLKEDLSKRDEEIKRICESQKIDSEQYMLTNKYMTDFHKRIGNQIINYVKEFEWNAEFNENLSLKAETFIRRVEKTKRKALIRRASTLIGRVNVEATTVFEEYERAIRNAEYEIMVENGEIERQ